MLDELHITALGVIEDATLRLSPGLTVVTGETGAGKTMLVTALQLLLGARADTSLVRHGAETAIVDARWCPAPPEAADWTDDPDELVATREIPAEGRSRARLSGRLAPATALTEVFGPHVEVHAQHDHVRLSQPRVQRELLDAFAGDPHNRTLAAYRQAFHDWGAARRRLDDLRASEQERARELDRLQYEVDEIVAADLADGDDRLDEQIDLLSHAEAVRQALREVSGALGSDGAQDPVGRALAALRSLPVETDQTRELQSAVQTVVSLMADAAAEARHAADDAESDPRRLEELVQRQHLVTSLLRKYGPDLADVRAYADRASQRIAQLMEDADAAEGLDDQVAELAAEVDRLAAAVRDGRRVAGDALAAVVEGHLADLAMPHASFHVQVDPGEPTSSGADEVGFLLAANPGEPPRPLGTSASGGERSRVALAVEVALADVHDASVLVFDEVDAGIGGATAMAVGEKLARLAAGGRRQVLCVTHLAQLAAYADVHHVVEKGISDGRTVTTTRQVHDDDRISELSRMLGGDASDEGLAHARTLFAEAARRRSA